MMTKDETKLMDGRQIVYPQYETNNESEPKKGNGSWKKVTFGAASGILVGAGAMYAAKAFGDNENETPEEQAATQQPEDVKVTKVSDDLSFQDAFDAARAQVGPGGVFRWNGGLYSTYKEDEWNAMSDEDKADFAQAIRPEVRADEIVAERMSEMQPQVVVVKEQVAADTHEAVAQNSIDNAQPMAHNAVDNDVAINTSSEQSQDSNDGDVHVVGQGYVQGHHAVAVDLTGNGVADVAIIDVDDSGTPTDPDVVVDREGNTATMGQIAQSQETQGQDDGYGYASDNTDPNMDPNLQQTAYDGNPDLSPDMPDYMNDADVTGSIV